MRCHSFAEILDTNEANGLQVLIDRFVLSHVMFQFLPQIINSFLLTHGLVVSRVTEDLNDVPFEQLLVFADALDEQDPESHIRETVFAQLATLLSCNVSTVENL